MNEKLEKDFYELKSLYETLNDALHHCSDSIKEVDHVLLLTNIIQSKFENLDDYIDSL